MTWKCVNLYLEVNSMAFLKNKVFFANIFAFYLR